MPPRCVDLAWRLAVTASTSETNASGVSRVVVRLTLEDDDARSDDDARDGRWFEQMEMSVAQFYAFAGAAARGARGDARGRVIARASSRASA